MGWPSPKQLLAEYRLGVGVCQQKGEVRIPYSQAGKAATRFGQKTGFTAEAQSAQRFCF
jgi:hypothetical protein